MAFDEIAPSVWRRPGTSGRTVGIVGGMHGDEPDGAAAVEALLAPEHPIWAACEDTVLLAIGNPEARAARVRFIDRDLNRLFGPEPVEGGGVEVARARVLREALAGVDVLVDLHQTHRPIPPLAVMRDTPRHRDLAASLGLRTAVTQARLVYGDTMLSDLVDVRGGVGLTVETGQAGTALAREVAESTVSRLLTAAHATAPLSVFRIEAVLESPGPDLRFRRLLVNGAPVAAGEVLGAGAAGSVVAPGTGVVFLPREGVAAGRPCALFAVATP